jgi:hypothetical protein
VKLPRHRLLSFRSPVEFDEDAVREMCRLACEGYHKRHKSETFGFLLGRLDHDGRLRAHLARYYRGGRKSRTGVVFKDWRTILRVHHRRIALARGLRLRYLGNFHSHVEIAGEVFKGMSADDLESFRLDPFASLEVIIFVWRGSSKHGRSTSGMVVAYDPRHRLNYRIRVYAKRKSGIRVVPARVCPADIIIVY